MNVIDIILGIMLLIGLIKGFQKGFIVELSGIVAILAGIYAGFNYSYYAEHYLKDWTDWSASSTEVAGFFLTFIGVMIVVSILAKILTTLLNSVALGFVNKLFGGLFGLIKTSLFLIILLLVFEYINGEGRFISVTKLENSVVISTLRELSSTFLPSLQEFIPKSKEA